MTSVKKTHFFLYNANYSAQSFTLPLDNETQSAAPHID